MDTPEDPMSRSTKPPVITIMRYKDGIRAFPAFIDMGHRHLQKEMPTGGIDGASRTFIVPVDLLRVVGIPDYLLDNIEEVQVAYQKRGK